MAGGCVTLGWPSPSRKAFTILAVIDPVTEARHATSAPLSLADICEGWVDGNRRRARNLALIALADTELFPYRLLCLAFGMKKPAISLAISRTKAALRHYGETGRYDGTSEAELAAEEATNDRQMRIQWPE